MAKRFKTKALEPTNLLFTLVEMEFFLSNHFDFKRNIIIPNVSWGLKKMHECDLFIIRKTGYVVEVEIKRSLADFKNDFKKKHNHTDNRIKDFYYAFPCQLWEKSSVKILELIPESAGVLVVYGELKTSVIKESISNKNARKLTDTEISKVLRLGCLRIWSLKRKIIKILEK